MRTTLHGTIYERYLCKSSDLRVASGSRHKYTWSKPFNNFHKLANDAVFKLVPSNAIPVARGDMAHADATSSTMAATECEPQVNKASLLPIYTIWA